jgi:hypothetical protein
VIASLDDSGNLTATNFINGSRREWKKNITPYTFDAISLLQHTDFAEYDCKDPRCGPTGMHKVGIIANDSPEQIAGKNHDHYDGFAMAAIDGRAIVELTNEVNSLRIAVGSLLIAMVLFGVLVGVMEFRRDA